YNYQVQGKKVVTMNSALDNRYAQGKIWRRAGFSIDAHIYETNTNIKNFITSFDELPASLLIDEAQSLSESQVIQLTELAEENIKELETEYMNCYKKASMVSLLDESGEPIDKLKQIDTDGNEKYLTVCRKCYKEVDASKPA